MKKLLALVGMLVLVSSCSFSAQPTGLVPGGQLSTPTANLDYTIIYEGSQTIPDLDEGYGIYGSRTDFNDINLGVPYTVSLTVVNGRDRDRIIAISVIQCTTPSEGYAPLSPKYFSWVTISQPTFELKTGQVREVPITLLVPDKPEYAGLRVEVNIRVDDSSQTGLVQNAYESLWFITTTD